MNRRPFSLPEEYLANYRRQMEMNRRRPFIIGVAGGTASGKTTVCEKIEEKLNDQRVCMLSQDNFYRPLTEEELKHVEDYNFDHPSAIDFDLMLEALQRLLVEGSVRIPVYDFTTHSRSHETKFIRGADIVIVEGILVFYSERLRNMMNMKVFVDTDSDTRLIRRIRRDISERGRSVHSVLAQYERFVKPSFENYVLPTKQFADIIIPRGGDNVVAIDLLVQHLRLRLEDPRNNVTNQGTVYTGEGEEEFDEDEMRLRHLHRHRNGAGGLVTSASGDPLSPEIVGRPTRGSVTSGGNLSDDEYASTSSSRLHGQSAGNAAPGEFFLDDAMHGSH